MNFRDALDDIRTDYREEVEAALAEARGSRDSLTAALRNAEREVILLEELLAPGRGPVATPVASGGSIPGQPKPGAYMTLHDAMHKVIKESPERRLRAAEILAEIERQGLYRMRDGRMPESQQIHARANNYPHLFANEGSYFVAR